MKIKKMILSELNRVKKEVLKESEEVFNKAKQLFNLSKNTESYSPEFEQLYNELSHGITGDIALALKYFQTADEFANYIESKRDKTGEYVWPVNRRNGLSDAEMTDRMENRKGF